MHQECENLLDKFNQWVAGSPKMVGSGSAWAWVILQCLNDPSYDQKMIFAGKDAFKKNLIKLIDDRATQYSPLAPEQKTILCKDVIQFLSAREGYSLIEIIFDIPRGALLYPPPPIDDQFKSFIEAASSYRKSLSGQLNLAASMRHNKKAKKETIEYLNELQGEEIISFISSSIPAAHLSDSSTRKDAVIGFFRKYNDREEVVSIFDVARIVDDSGIIIIQAPDEGTIDDQKIQSFKNFLIEKFTEDDPETIELVKLLNRSGSSWYMVAELHDVGLNDSRYPLVELAF